MSAFLSIVTTLRHGRTRWPGLATCHRIPRPHVISYGHALPARSDPPARRGLGHRPAPQIRTGALPAIYLFCPMPSNGNPQLHDQGPSLPSGGVASTCPNEGQNPVPHVRLLLLLASLQLADVCPRLLAHTPNSPPEPHPSRRPRPGPPHRQRRCLPPATPIPTPTPFSHSGCRNDRSGPRPLRDEPGPITNLITSEPYEVDPCRITDCSDQPDCPG